MVFRRFLCLKSKPCDALSTNTALFWSLEAMATDATVRGYERGSLKLRNFLS
jgi:hypothetical protein